MIVLSVLGTLLIAIGVVTPAASAIHSGYKGCHGQFAYLTGTTRGETAIAPPGSYYGWAYSTGGTRTHIAVDSAWNSKKGGGNWTVTGTHSATGNPYCSALG